VSGRIDPSSAAATHRTPPREREHAPAAPAQTGAEPPGRAGAFFGPLALAVAGIALIALFLPARYEANDDFAIVRQLDPRNGFATDPHVRYLSWFLSRLLHALYAALPGIPWYGLTLYLGLALGAGLLAGTAWRAARGWAAWLWVPAFTLFLGFCAAFLSFTSVSLVLLLGAMLGALEWHLRGAPPTGVRRRHAALLAAAFLFALLLRWKLVLPALTLVLPPLLVARRPPARRMILAALVALLVLGADRAIDRVGESPGWHAYDRYNSLRSRFHDTEAGRYHEGVTDAALTRAGWTREDYETFRHWMLYDDHLFTRERLETFLEANWLETEKLPVAVWSAIRQNVAENARFLAAALLSVLGLALFAVARRRGGASGGAATRAAPPACPSTADSGDRRAELGVRGPRLVMGALGLIACGVLFLLGYRFLPRVFLPILAYWIAAACLLIGPSMDGRGGPLGEARDSSRGREKSPARGAGGRSSAKFPSCLAAARIAALSCAAAVLVLVFAEGAGIMNLLRQSERTRARALGALTSLRERSGGEAVDLVLMDPVRGLHFECLHPLRELRGIAPTRVFLGGAALRSPRERRVLSELGLPDGRAFLRSLADHPRILLALETSGEQHAHSWELLWHSYLQRNVFLDHPVRLRPVLDLRDRRGAGYVFYRLESVPATTPAAR